MIHGFFSKVQIFFKRYFTIYVILDFTPYEKNEKNEVDDVNKASETVCALK
jgi:hypothetical protein